MREPDSLCRVRLTIHGAVQGVGFRPFVYRLARDLGLVGWVRNTGQGLLVEVEGDPPAVDRFMDRVVRENPPRSFIQSLESVYLDPAGFACFEIRESEEGPKTTLILPDIATCPLCLQEIFDPTNRRFRYPFTNCTYCGPRYSIIHRLPYDRPNTSMAGFRMCEVCVAEYSDPGNRRFHAQPNACPDCGPQLSFRDSGGAEKAVKEEALQRAVDGIRTGRILAVKGLGGFHLMVDAGDGSAVRKLRQRKHRDEKPFALMVPDVRWAGRLCKVSPLERRILTSPERPIVLLERRDDASAGSCVHTSVAPGNPCLGIMLPYTPLHHLLMADLGFPVVATSGNLSDEPICIHEEEALERLSGIADGFLVHDRPIVRHIDDSVVRVIGGREMVLRRARGYAPLPVLLEHPLAKPAVGVGALLKNAVALGSGNRVFLSQHIGDLETEASYRCFVKTIRDLAELHDTHPEVMAHDLHPDYLSTRYARETGTETLAVQHHWAHVLACAVENQIDPPFLGVSWDGTGFGPDGTVWGGEFLVPREGTFLRAGRFLEFPLPGGDQAVREPRRSALGCLYTLFRKDLVERLPTPLRDSFTKEELSVLAKMLASGTRSVRTSSAGRLFDAVSAILGIRFISRYEGQAAMELEFLLNQGKTDEAYEMDCFPLEQGREQGFILDWRPVFRSILEDLEKGVPRWRVAARFHNALVRGILRVAHHTGLSKVLLTGGCFQNRYLTEQTVEILRREGFQPYWHQRVPPNDGGVALGQVVAASWKEEAGSHVSGSSR